MSRYTLVMKKVLLHLDLTKKITFNDCFNKENILVSQNVMYHDIFCVILPKFGPKQCNGTSKSLKIALKFRLKNLKNDS